MSRLALAGLCLLLAAPAASQAPDVILASPTEIDAAVAAMEKEMKPGDTFLIPAGVPHGFGVEGGRLVLLGIKVTVGR